MRFKIGIIIYIIIFQSFIDLTRAQDIYSEEIVESDSVGFLRPDSILLFEMSEDKTIGNELYLKDTLKLSDKANEFVPNSTKAVWYSVIFPGLGQIYNKKYWKLPIVYGGFVGIAYGLSFNQRYYTDYSIAYRDAMGNDPNKQSYKDFIPSSWTNMTEIQRVMKRKKDFYRRYRDLSIIGLVAMYAVCMIDAYVDAELYTFDISPDLSFRIEPTVTNPTYGYQTFSNKSLIGISCSINF